MALDSTLDPEVEYALMSGQEKSAILLSTLGVSTSNLIFEFMRDNDVKRMINGMASSLNFG